MDLKRIALVMIGRPLEKVITSRPENYIIQIFSNSISTHVNILFGSNIKLGDSASDDIWVFLKL